LQARGSHEVVYRSLARKAAASKLHLPKKYIALDFGYAQSVVNHIFLRPSPRIAKAKKQLRVLTTQYGRISDYEF
jgi:hypothetical protein